MGEDEAEFSVFPESKDLNAKFELVQLVGEAWGRISSKIGGLSLIKPLNTEATSWGKGGQWS